MTREKYIIKNRYGEYFWRGQVWYKFGWTKNIEMAYRFSTLKGVMNRVIKYPGCKIMKIKVDLTIIDENFSPRLEKK